MINCRYFSPQAVKQEKLFKRANFYQILAILAIAMLLPLGGGNNSQTTSEDPPSETATVKEPETSKLDATLSAWLNPQLLRGLESDATPIRSIAISPDSQTLGSSSLGGKIKEFYRHTDWLYLEGGLA